jgi:hypothetical protein
LQELLSSVHQVHLRIILIPLPVICFVKVSFTVALAFLVFIAVFANLPLAFFKQVLFHVLFIPFTGVSVFTTNLIL